jgi:hypothetical protein
MSVRRRGRMFDARVADRRSRVPRYIVERTLPRDGLTVVPEVIQRNADDGVTWIHSYVSEERDKTFCVYDAPSPEAIRKTSARSALSVDRITQVRVFDPYSYR